MIIIGVGMVHFGVRGKGKEGRGGDLFEKVCERFFLTQNYGFLERGLQKTLQ